MDHHFHFHFHHAPGNEAPTWAVELKALMEKQMAAIDDLAALVAQEDTAIDAAVVLLNGIPALIANAGLDPVKLKALQDDITTRTATLAAAVVTGTPQPPAGGPPITPQAAKVAAQASVAANPPA